MSVLAPSAPERLVGSPESLRLERRVVRGVVARHVARVLVFESHQFEGMEIKPLLESIPYVRRERALRWIVRAGVNPARLVEELTLRQRELIAGQLELFARNMAA